MSSMNFPGVRWHGHWVAPDVPEFSIDPTSVGSDLPPAGFSRAHFRRVLELGDVPASAPLRVSADSRYVLWVNGAEVGRGPIRSQPRRLRYDEYDIAGHLRPGRNAVAVLVTYYGHPNSFWQPAASSGVMGRDVQVVLEARLGDEWLVTDERWRALRSRAWRAPAAGKALDGVPIEMLDARELDPGWTEPEFDDSVWASATVLKAGHDGALAESRPPTDPYGALLPRGVAALGGQRIAAPSITVRSAPALTGLPDHPAERLIRQLRVGEAGRTGRLPLTVQRGDDRATLVGVDFGRIVAGHVELEVDAPPGVRLDLFYQESAGYDAVAGPVDSAPRSSATYVTRGHADHYRAVDVNGLRQLFLMIPAGTGTVIVREIAVSEYHYPFIGGAAFESGDPELDRLYRAGIRTTELNSFDAFTDCPTREQRAWVGDGVVHQMVHLAGNEDWRLARNYVTLGASPRADGMLPMSVAGEIEYRGGYTIPDWALHWIHGVWNLYRHDGDRAATLRMLPVVERVLRWYEPFVDEHGTLTDVPEWNLIDWSSVFSHGRSSLITGLWARGLAEFAEMADWVGNAASAAWARERWAGARAGYEDFWDPGRGSYVDHVLDGVRMPAMSQAAGAVAIVSGLAPAERRSGIIDVITDASRLVVRSWIGGADGGYDMTKIVEHSQGVYRIDWDAEREIVLAEPFFSYVVHDAVAAAGKAHLLPDLLRRWSVFLHDGFDTFGECWGWGTPVHAWSATPTKDLIWYVLGVTPAEPGFAAVRVAPRPGALANLTGAVPTPHGLVRVTVTDGRVHVDSPVPVHFVALSGAESTAPAGTSEFSL
ncbi:alpha-L-rhamnosidase N-terminal domain-containing protein [Actinoplanes sp. NPDC051861]|uniref:alpha-L-rhamnosidase-related protein n=1 Tax=Actinoplanes sp. NPDC051861 TaxID=3155170 RepID=UPI00342D8521